MTNNITMISLSERVASNRQNDDFKYFIQHLLHFLVRFSRLLTSCSDVVFPKDFLFGVSSAAYQIEGAWNLDGKGPSIWDEFCHSHPEKIADGLNGDVSANSYELFLDDIEAVKHLNVNFYRFSIAWSRVLPTGDIAKINEDGIKYYDKLINKLIENNIEPMIAMYHFDLPNHLQQFGGFTNSIIVSYFEEYANLLFNRFGDRVKYWITLNEPAEFCVQGYGTDHHAPALNLHGIGEYLCVHNALKAHAMAYHLYKNQFYDRFKGKVGISLDTQFYYSDTNDTDAVDLAMQFSLGWLANPIFSQKGDYPDAMITRIANNSIREGRLRSRLPTFSRQWIDKIRGSADFFGLNYYTSRYVELPIKPNGEDPSIERDRVYEWKVKPEWKQAESTWLYSVPEGLGDVLRWIKAQYKNPEVILLENGWSDKGEIEDNGRITYFHDHLNQVLDAIHNNACNITGYSVWSLIDNFEWISGYTQKFGLYSVNMTSAKKERTPKKSVEFIKTMIETRRIPKI